MTPYLTYLRLLKNGEIHQETKKSMKKIKPFSDKRAKLNREYGRESRARWQGQPCSIRSPVCTGISEGMHHLAGKGTPELLLDPDNQIPACNPCNLYVEVHDAWARRNGFKLSRLKKKS